MSAARSAAGAIEIDIAGHEINPINSKTTKKTPLIFGGKRKFNLPLIV
jgi:hypothetical protein